LHPFSSSSLFCLSVCLSVYTGIRDLRPQSSPPMLVALPSLTSSLSLSLSLSLSPVCCCMATAVGETNPRTFP
jgi:hypothetical protein